MEVVGDGSWLGAVIEVFCVDLLLGIDNALLIALVCRSLRPEHRVEALLFGAAGAVVFRTVLALCVGLILRVPALRLAGGLVLFLIALTVAPNRDAAEQGLPGGPADGGRAAPRSLGAGIALVFLADAVVSLDNALAVGAIARGSAPFTLVGLAGSVPLVMVGGLLLSRMLERLRSLAILGAVIVGWIAGELAVTDPLISGWAASQAPAWSIVVPGLCALFVALDANMGVSRRA